MTESPSPTTRSGVRPELALAIEGAAACAVPTAVTPTDIVVMDVIGWDAAPGSAGLVAPFGHGGGGGGGASHGGVASRDGNAIGVQVTAHQVLGHDPSFAATGHIEANGHVASPFDIRGSGTDWHLV